MPCFLAVRVWEVKRVLDNRRSVVVVASYNDVRGLSPVPGVDDARRAPSEVLAAFYQGDSDRIGERGIGERKGESRR